MARTFNPAPFTRPPPAASVPHRAAWPLPGRAPESNPTSTYRHLSVGFHAGRSPDPCHLKPIADQSRRRRRTAAIRSATNPHVRAGPAFDPPVDGFLPAWRGTGGSACRTENLAVRGSNGGPACSSSKRGLDGHPSSASRSAGPLACREFRAGTPGPGCAPRGRGSSVGHACGRQHSAPPGTPGCWLPGGPR